MESITKQTWESGQFIFRQGDNSTQMYHIQSGRVGIFLPRAGVEVMLAELGPGSMFGEMAFLCGPPRTASAMALEPVTLNVIPEALLKQNLAGIPVWGLSIARVLADRLKHTTSSLDQLLYEKAHTAIKKAGGAPLPSFSIIPQSLEIHYYPESDAHRLYLSGVLDETRIEELMNRINSLRRQRISPVILNFSNVIEVQRKAMEAVIGLARASTVAVGQVQIENIQLIADKLQKYVGIQEIIHQNETPFRRVNYGDHLMLQGQPGTEMYVVKSGRLTVYRKIKDKEVLLWTAEEGDVIGEMALISGKVRTASVRADKSSVVYVIDISAFQKNTYHIPRWFMGIIEALVSRLRETDRKLDAFVSHRLLPWSGVTQGRLEIFEDARKPGRCRLSGPLTAQTVGELKLYLGSRLKRGVRHFDIDLAKVSSLDEEARKTLKRFRRTLLSLQGTLQFKGPAPMPIGPAVQPVRDAAYCS